MSVRRVMATGAALLLSCSSHFGTGFPDASVEDAALTDGGGVDAPTFADATAPPADAQGGPSTVFAQSPDTLYKLDPMTKAVSVVAPFSGCSQVTDIALDASSNMFASTLDGLYRIDPSTAVCTRIATGSYPNSLSFVPAGTLDPNVDALVGYLGDQYVHINTTTGALTTVGAIGGGYSSSGDIVSVKGGGTYLTVKGGPNSCNDCLIQVDPKTGAFLMEWGPVNHTNVFGIAFWGGAVYGFDNAGEVFEIDFNGLAMQITTIPVPNAPAGLQFFGAGSTTVAPLVQ